MIPTLYLYPAGAYTDTDLSLVATINKQELFGHLIDELKM